MVSFPVPQGLASYTVLDNLSPMLLPFAWIIVGSQLCGVEAIESVFSPFAVFPAA
jgi:hypothetical protein